METWELVSTELATIDARHDHAIGGGGQVSLDHTVSVSRKDKEKGGVSLMIGTHTILVGMSENDKEAFRISCNFKGIYHTKKDLREVEELELAPTETDFFGQQMYLVIRPLLVSMLTQMNIYPIFLPFTLPDGIPVEEDILEEDE